MAGAVLLLTAASLTLAVPGAGAQADGRNFHVEGGGWGHGVGMSQYGAYGRAQAGQTAEQILGFYYRGAQVEALPMPSGIRVWMAEVDGGSGVLPRIRSAAFSATIIVGAYMLALVMPGNTEASTTRSPSRPCTRIEAGSTTGPIAQVHDG